MRREMIETYIRKLSSAFGGIRPPVKKERLLELHTKKDFTGMVGFIRTTLSLDDIRMRVGLVTAGGLAGNIPAWVSFPNPMPIYATPAFKHTLVTIFLRKAFLNQRPFEMVVVAIAHELSHIVLEAIGHTLMKKEEAVDITAMLFGYRNFYRVGCRMVDTEPIGSQSFFQKQMNSVLDYIFEKRSATYFYHVGDLTYEEVQFAAELMDRGLGTNRF
ncbi:MAG: hypothetical protein G01um101470_535 [Parcubacteria group bacterium Gr01-1014_70]|nr:MAG: hypothetical protein G01um101470_535 [Parcubacteria group bacterium Gr01-1014_70]